MRTATQRNAASGDASAIARREESWVKLLVAQRNGPSALPTAREGGWAPQPCLQLSSISLHRCFGFSPSTRQAAQPGERNHIRFRFRSAFRLGCRSMRSSASTSASTSAAAVAATSRLDSSSFRQAVRLSKFRANPQPAPKCRCDKRLGIRPSALVGALAVVGKQRFPVFGKSFSISDALDRPATRSSEVEIFSVCDQPEPSGQRLRRAVLPRGRVERFQAELSNRKCPRRGRAAAEAAAAVPRRGLDAGFDPTTSVAGILAAGSGQASAAAERNSIPAHDERDARLAKRQLREGIGKMPFEEPLVSGADGQHVGRSPGVVAAGARRVIVPSRLRKPIGGPPPLVGDSAVLAEQPTQRLDAFGRMPAVRRPAWREPRFSSDQARQISNQGAREVVAKAPEVSESGPAEVETRRPWARRLADGTDATQSVVHVETAEMLLHLGDCALCAARSLRRQLAAAHVRVNSRWRRDREPRDGSGSRSPTP